MIFATPDFGASSGIICVVLLAWALVIGFVLWGLARGVRLLQGGSPRRKGSAILLLVVSGLLPFACCLGPSQAVRLRYGNYPIGSYPNGKIKEGMTADEVVAILGTPHERHRQDDRESWGYWIDSFCISWFGVGFGPDGRVKSTGGN